MDARAVVHPVGPHEPRVYWTRRAVLMLAVLVVIVVFSAYACSGSNAPVAGRPNPTSSSSPSPAATGATTASACSAGQLTVSVDTDAATYPAGALPHLRVTVRNTSADPCLLRATAALVSWQIVSGPDVVWTNAGCPLPSLTSAPTTTLRANHPWRAPLVWDRHRSTKGCASPGVSAAAGTYQARATVAGVRSTPAVFHLTG
jgi:hypothetical protein